MKTIRARMDFTLHGAPYYKGDEIENLKIEEVIMLNEKGFIEPLTQRDIVSLMKEKENKNKMVDRPKIMKDGER